MSLSFGGILVAAFFILYDLTTVTTWTNSLSNLEGGLGLLAGSIVLLVISGILFRRRAKRLGITGAMYRNPPQPKTIATD